MPTGDLKDARIAEKAKYLIGEWERHALRLENDSPHVKKAAEELALHLPLLWQDHWDKTATELEELADRLSPVATGLDDAGLLARLILWEPLWLGVNVLLLAALVWRNWPFGKLGYQFMPNPLKLSLEEYRDEAWTLLNMLEEATGGDPMRLLTGDDLEFYKSLPKTLTVWRGSNGISPEQAGAGVCWTTRREIAVGFAHRSKHRDCPNSPVLMRARIRKSEIVLAKAYEYEVVVAPHDARVVPLLKREMVMVRPENMAWTPAATCAPA
ncbi:MAG TPA: hypothetical protein VHU18_00495 [Rhizomicrobium sp.]|jgi:hypothetical protein|nr:hypothetical protein [Rhizomicrobium sp.]